MTLVQLDTDLSCFEFTGNRVLQRLSWLDWRRSESKDEVIYFLVVFFTLPFVYVNTIYIVVNLSIKKKLTFASYSYITPQISEVEF